MITLVRIGLIPLFVRFYLEGEMAAAMALLLAAAFSDMLDGYIARRFDMITPLGKVLDPVADKLLQLSMLLCLAGRSPAVLPLILLHLVRELVLFCLGGVVYRSRGILLGSRWYGKVCTAFMYTVLGTSLLWRNMPQILLNGSLMLCAVMIVYCLVRYAAEYMHILRRGETIKKPT